TLSRRDFWRPWACHSWLAIRSLEDAGERVVVRGQMDESKNKRTIGVGAYIVAPFVLALALAGCSTSSSLLDTFSTTKKTDTATAAQPAAGATTGTAASAAVGPGGVGIDDFECPGVQIARARRR